MRTSTTAAGTLVAHTAHLTFPLPDAQQPEVIALIAAYAERGVTVSVATAARYRAQRAAEERAWDAYLTAPIGAPYDWAGTRPYGMQILCDCGKDFALWAIEQMVDEKPDRLVFCQACAEVADKAGEGITFVQLLTVEQTDVLRTRDAADIGN
jgi:hypothetical protein